MTAKQAAPKAAPSCIICDGPLSEELIHYGEICYDCLSEQSEHERFLHDIEETEQALRILR